MGIGKRIRERRMALGMSRAALAYEINVRRGKPGADAKAIARWEDGGVEPKLSTIHEIAEALGVDPVWLAFGAAEAA